MIAVSNVGPFYYIGFYESCLKRIKTNVVLNNIFWLCQNVDNFDWL